MSQILILIDLATGKVHACFQFMLPHLEGGKKRTPEESHKACRDEESPSSSTPRCLSAAGDSFSYKHKRENDKLFAPGLLIFFSPFG